LFERRPIAFAGAFPHLAGGDPSSIIVEDLKEFVDGASNKEIRSNILLMFCQIFAKAVTKNIIARFTGFFGSI
jgi:hypothetical protein